MRAAGYALSMLSYLDAGTGSMLMAAFAGGAAGIGVLFRMYGHRILGVFSKKHKAQAEESFHELMGDTNPD
jgi:hypothetical protein